MKTSAVLALLVLCSAPYDTALAQEQDVIESGRQEFNMRCVVCHGAEGKGDGVLAEHLKQQPANLTLLSNKSEGTFPFWETYRKIDGRDVVGAHGPDDMPVWGDDEELEGVGGRLAMGQILTIVFFLQSVQEE
jgi:mono/diheme cytochrome c family protein